MQKIDTISKTKVDIKPRLSNIELLRIFSMFGVLVVHADFGALGHPTRNEFISYPYYTCIRTFIEAFALMSVNIFVLISGWFGIRFSWNALCKLLFQCAFFFFGIFIILKFCGLSDTGWGKGIYMCLMMSSNAWFVKSYIGMFIFAPVMNSFIENSSERQIRLILVCFFLFNAIYGWLTDGASYINGGYSAFSFMGLYLLARYIRLYRPKFSQMSISKDFACYIVCSCITAIGLLLFTYLDVFPLYAPFFKYTSLLTIAAALFLLLAFSKMSFCNRAVNQIAISCFAVYLFHFMIFGNFIGPYIRYIDENFTGLTKIGLISVILIIFYITAVLVDKVRIIIWNKKFARYFKRYKA